MTRYAGEADYSAAVLSTFERFRQGAVRDYRVRYRTGPGMNHVAAQVLELVAKLFGEEFAALDEYCSRHAGFLDEGIRQAHRELQFCLAYLDYVRLVRAAGLSFCYPEVSAVGCPVPGSAARLFLFDRLFTHFEREEDIAAMRGKLEDDLVRIGEILLAASGDSIVILNETFASTTTRDARFLGTKLLTKVMQLDAQCVYVTFVDELASLGEQVVSMMSTVVADNPAERTYKVVRKPADGLAYALAIAEKYGLSYERLRERVAP